MTATPPLTGSCLCGRVRYAIDAAPLAMYHCHCSVCRTASGAGFATNVAVATESFRVVQGADALAAHESSPGKQRYFCGACGSPVYSHAEATRHLVSVRSGTLHARPGIRPTSTPTWRTRHRGSRSRTACRDTPRPGARMRDAPSPSCGLDAMTATLLTLALLHWAVLVTPRAERAGRDPAQPRAASGAPRSGRRSASAPSPASRRCSPCSASTPSSRPMPAPDARCRSPAACTCCTSRSGSGVRNRRPSPTRMRSTSASTRRLPGRLPDQHPEPEIGALLRQRVQHRAAAIAADLADARGPCRVFSNALGLACLARVLVLELGPVRAFYARRCTAMKPVRRGAHRGLRTPAALAALARARVRGDLIGGWPPVSG